MIPVLQMGKLRHREATHSRPLETVSSPTLPLWSLRTLRSVGEPGPNTLGKCRLEPHLGRPGLLFSPVQNQATVLPFPGPGGTP